MSTPTPRLLPSPQVHDAEPVTNESLIDSVLEEVKELQHKVKDLRRDFETFRNGIAKMLQGARVVYGGMGTPEQNKSDVEDGQPIPAERYTMWKQRLSPACGKVIDALLVHPMNNTQLKKYCGLGTSTVSLAIHTLAQAKLVEKDGDLNVLRRI